MVIPLLAKKLIKIEVSVNIELILFLVALLVVARGHTLPFIPLNFLLIMNYSCSRYCTNFHFKYYFKFVRGVLNLDLDRFIYVMLDGINKYLDSKSLKNLGKCVFSFIFILF